MKENPFQALPDHVQVGGVRYPVETGFRLGVSIETELLKEEEPDVAGLLTRFYKGEIPGDIKEAMEEMMRFFCGPEIGAAKNGQKKKGGRQYDFEQDADVLLSSFLSAYNIDLSTAQLHWWTFRRLMLNLPADAPFMQRVHYRAADTSKMGKDMKKHYNKMKELYALRATHKREITAQERDEARKARLDRRYEEAMAYAAQRAKED